jgi:drug/metabolite transporter (DMT)-like permease
MKKAFIQLHIAVFLAGFTGILGRLITLNEGLIVWYRLFITAITMWIIFSLTKKLKQVKFSDKLKLAGIGFLSALHWVTFYGAIKYANVSVALVCFSAVGFFTALFEPFVTRSRMKWMDVFLGMIVMAGIYLIFHFDPGFKTGIILGIISAFLIAIAITLLKQYVVLYNPETALTWQLSGGLAVLSLFMPFYLNRFPTDHIWPTFSDWMWLLVLAWLCSVIAFQFSTYALNKLSAFTVNLTFNMEPVYGILLAFVVYNENELLSKWFYIGFGMIAMALLIHVWMVWEKKPIEPNKIKQNELP